MNTCDILDMACYHNVLGQVPSEYRKVGSKKRIRWLHVCQCLNRGEEIVVPLWQETEATSRSLANEDFSVIKPMPVARYRRDGDYRRRKIWRYSYVGDVI